MMAKLNNFRKKNLGIVEKHPVKNNLSEEAESFYFFLFLNIHWFSSSVFP